MGRRFLLAAALSVAGCDGGDKSPTVADTTQTAAETPADPRLGLPIYPGARVLATAQADGDGGANATFQLESTAAPQDVIAFYRNAAIRDGFVIKTDVNAGGLRMIGALKGEESLTIQVAPRANGTGANVTVVRGR